jgi:hypothetical protein
VRTNFSVFNGSMLSLVCDIIVNNMTAMLSLLISSVLYITCDLNSRKKIVLPKLKERITFIAVPVLP